MRVTQNDRRVCFKVMDFPVKHYSAVATATISRDTIKALSRKQSHALTSSNSANMLPNPLPLSLAGLPSQIYSDGIRLRLHLQGQWLSLKGVHLVPVNFKHLRSKFRLPTSKLLSSIFVKLLYVIE